MRLIFLDWFWFVLIPTGGIVKFPSHAQFPVDYISRPVLPSLVLYLYKFTAFTYHVINRFSFFSTSSTLAILLRIINFRFDIIQPYDVVCYYYCKKFSFSLYVCPDVQIFSYAIS